MILASLTFASLTIGASSLSTSKASPFFHQDGISSESVCRAALKASGAKSGEQSWILTGNCKYREAADSLEIDLDGKSRFRIATRGGLASTVGFDGKSCWEASWSGVAHKVDVGSPLYYNFVGWVLSGAWALKGTPIVMKEPTVDGDRIIVPLQLPGIAIAAQLTLTKTTMLPERLSFTGDSGKETWIFGGYQRFGSRTFATAIQDVLPGQTDPYTVTDAKQARVREDIFHPEDKGAIDVAFDHSAQPSVQFKSIAGYMFVQPKVDGKEAGWFFLDTGAEGMCIDPKFAKDLGAVEVGHDVTSGVVATLRMPICRTQSFTLGPVTLNAPTFLELDMSPFSKGFGMDIRGICGYNLLARCIDDIDPATSKLSLYEATDPSLPTGAKWEPMMYSGQVPCVKCGFESGQMGLFTLDTGSGSSVDFYSPTVARLHMTEGGPTQKIQTGGAGGSAESLSKKIASFTLGTHRFEGPTVGLQLTKEGVFSVPYLDGNIGMTFMAHYRLIFDYPRNRVCLIWIR
ncbi:MAG: retropepsin-like aspartic protease [Fimbriimonas sp.]|nr:retropepsin-like aspartic protease [Fimbriimonas sp.]